MADRNPRASAKSKGANRYATPAPLASRYVALELLAAVSARGQPFDEAMDSHTGFTRLSGRDRGFVHNLCATTLRRLGQIDALIAACVERPLANKADAEIAKNILRLGICQLVFLKTPPHAAVDTSVQLARKRRASAFAGLINAVLRRVGREGEEMLGAQDAAQLNTPGWLWESWSETYGTQTCRAIAEAHLGEPPLDLTLKGEKENWAEQLDAKELPGGSLRMWPRGPITELPGFGEGAWWVQDAAAAYPARLLGDVAGKNIVDLCAAPGGKTAQLAAMGANVTAIDRAAGRLKRLQSNMARLGLKVKTETADGTLWRPGQPVDAVLLDAPCSATGTLRRHPDVAQLKSTANVADLALLQARLLEAAWGMVKPGGLIVYCACSLQPEEGPQLIERALASGAPIERIPISAHSTGAPVECINTEGDLRCLPSHMAELGGMDGFFAARLRRKAE
ncbi:MAG: 16S rRNA (cytosine(967)-C(5))-methyltransferase RsmB [Rhodospirillales bacterium]|jgi:16S rRNA (cytosine967-C5)-methyltransferase|nr:16S rRNA (cytosine(967)-C(5))-methyltransferase RsmB [Rhodospirillales bacterium]